MYMVLESVTVEYFGDRLCYVYTGQEELLLLYLDLSPVDLS